MVKKTEKPESPEITEVKNQIGWLKAELSRLESLIPLPPDLKSWYTSPAIWLALLLTLIMLALIVIFYITESGHSIKILNYIITRNGIKF